MTQGGSIFLTGFMGAGKTTVARYLGMRLGKKWWDLDTKIQADTGMPIRDFFSRYGESTFREKELAALKEIPEGEIVSLGGGAFIQNKVRSLITTRGRSLYLALPLPVLWERVKGKKRRPLVGGYGALKMLYSERMFYYELADFTIWLSGLENPRDVADLILEQID